MEQHRLPGKRLVLGTGKQRGLGTEPRWEKAQQQGGLLGGGDDGMYFMPLSEILETPTGVERWGFLISLKPNFSVKTFIELVKSFLPLSGPTEGWRRRLLDESHQQAVL